MAFMPYCASYIFFLIWIDYSAGSTVKITFVGACPRNNLRLEGTFLEVQRFNSTTSSWNTYATDSDVETRLHFEKVKFGVYVYVHVHVHIALFTMCYYCFCILRLLLC